MLSPGDVSYEEHERLIGHSCGARPRIAISGGDDGVPLFTRELSGWVADAGMSQALQR